MRWSDARTLAAATVTPRPARISRQDAWQPVAVTSFDASLPRQKTPAELEAEAAAQAEKDLARQLEASWQAGHEAGVQEAGARHREEEKQHGMTVRARAGALLSDFEVGLKALEEGLADEVLTLALTLAERIACEQIRVGRDALAPILAESMKHISERARHLEVTVNPADVESAQQWFAVNHPEITVRVLAAGRVARGGCTLAAGSTRVDSQLETRVARAFAALGHSHGVRPAQEAQASGTNGTEPAQGPQASGTESIGPAQKPQASGAESTKAAQEPQAAGTESAEPAREPQAAGAESAEPARGPQASSMESTGPARGPQASSVESTGPAPRSTARKRKTRAQTPSPSQEDPTDPSATG